MIAEHCPVCDRETCQREAMASSPLSGNIFPYFKAHNDCDSHRVDWRARALKSEDRISALRAWAKARIEECRAEEAKYGHHRLAIRVAVEAARERGVLQAVLRILDEGKS